MVGLLAPLSSSFYPFLSPFPYPFRQISLERIWWESQEIMEGMSGEEIETWET